MLGASLKHLHDESVLAVTRSMHLQYSPRCPNLVQFESLCLRFSRYIYGAFGNQSVFITMLC